jgi:hypothetical protein
MAGLMILQMYTGLPLIDLADGQRPRSNFSPTAAELRRTRWLTVDVPIADGVTPEFQVGGVVFHAEHAYTCDDCLVVVYRRDRVVRMCGS